jgi:hypothetical protein
MCFNSPMAVLDITKKARLLLRLELRQHLKIHQSRYLFCFDGFKNLIYNVVSRT